MTNDLTKIPLVLSFGRSGSMLLTHNIGSAIGTVPVTVTATDKDFLKTYKLTAPVQSHRLHTLADISNFTCLFNLRKDPVNTILSMVLAKHFDVYHVWKDSSVELKPFIFDNWSGLEAHCRTYMRWCRHYTPMLNSSHYVVYYEDYIRELTDDEAYQKTFPKKSELIINYQQVKDCVLNFKDRMLLAQEAFAKLPTYKFKSSEVAVLDNY